MIRHIASIIIVAHLFAGCGRPITVEPVAEEETPDASVVEAHDHGSSPTSPAIEAVGIIDVPPSSKEMIYARTDAYMLSINVLEGQEVHKGEVVAVLQSPHFAQLQRDLQEAKAEFDLTGSAFERISKLKTSAAVSDKQFEQARYEHDRANARYQGLKSELESIGFNTSKLTLSDRLEVRSPIHGVVTQLPISNGQKVNADSHLMTLIDRSHMHVEVQVPANAIGMLVVGDTFSFTAMAFSDTLLGTVHLINDAVDMSTNTVKVHGHFLNEKENGRMKVGERVFVKFAF
ncbi:MAG: efflux RND transporter periplasmic adaptor subunit [Flavobacteriales bacterium]|nr:efflux RND transporter periplasmic adaptor subunit [Flavobacteriales bacterium]